MGLFSKEVCEFCGNEVGVLKRSKLATKEFICNDCRKKVNYFARMDYTSKENVQIMMDTLGQDEEDFEKSFDAAEGRFARAERNFHTWDLGSKRVQYRCNTSLGAFQLLLDDMSRYEHVPVFWFSRMMPYEFQSDDSVFSSMRRSKMMDEGAEYVEVKEEKGDDGKVKSCTLVIPYDDICIREIRIESEVSEEGDVEAFHSLADEINGDRRVWLSKSEFDLEQKNKMQVRNLGDTAAEALKTAIKGGDVEEVLKKGIETANEIEEGKVKRGFFGKLFKK
ncbi:MAG: hypothetical protein IJO55_01565 [Lachnospiraceae bacterium]|nr:hypothetical protein [Lachnospiraceae bacterium]